MRNNLIPPIILDRHRNFYITGLTEYDISKERFLETFRAGQDYAEQILEKLNFKGDINKSIKTIEENIHKRNDRER